MDSRRGTMRAARLALALAVFSAAPITSLAASPIDPAGTVQRQELGDPASAGPSLRHWAALLAGWQAGALGQRSYRHARAAKAAAGDAAADAPAAQSATSAALEALRASAASNLTQLVRLWFHHNTTLPSQWPEQRKQCAPGCTRLGNCNAQTGECECPYGRAGPACELLLLPSCR